jgi:glycosyltransferase involved in cell wall biosynthesis
MPQAELANQIKNWDLQIFLSKREGLGNAILEAGACGVPTLCWDIVGTRDAVPNFMKNFLIPYKRKDKMQEAVIRYIKTPLKSTEKRRLADWYKKNFSQREVLDVFVIFIKSTLRYRHGQ